MNIYVLGPPDIQAQPPIYLTSRKTLALFIALALDGSYTREALAGLLWPGARELSLQSLRASILTLRTALRNHGYLLKTDREKITLDTSHISTDADRIDTADENEILTLWRGPFLHGLHVEGSAEWNDWVDDWSKRLLSRFRARVKSITFRLLDEERFDEAEQFARRHLELDALSEYGAELLLDVLVRAGRVVQAYQDAAAFTQRFIHEFDLPPPLPPLPPLPTPSRPSVVRTNLQFERTNYIERPQEQDQVRAALKHARLVTLHGPGGLGKTRLARAIGRSLAAEGIYDFVAFVSVENVQHAEELPACIAAALGRPLTSSASGFDELAGHLGQTPVLLILDNFEHLVSDAHYINALLGLCPHVHLLVTSRERLLLRAETVVSVATMHVPGGLASLEAIQQADAVRLFVDRAKSARFDFASTQDLWSLVRRACELVGGLPLGIELAAAWTGSWPLAFIIKELERDPLTLPHPLRDIPGRHSSLRTSFDLSWRFLHESEQRILARLSIFQGGFTLRAAWEVVGASPEELAQLADKALINFDGVDRYIFHPMVREYAQGHLNTSPEERDAMLAAHAAYFVQSLGRERLSTAGAASQELLAFVRSEEANLLAALPYLQRTRQYAALESLAEPLLWHFPAVTGPSGFATALRLAQRLLSTLSADEPAAQAARLAVMSSYAWLLLFVGSLKASVGMYEDAVRLARTLGDEAALQRALDGLGQALYRSAQPEAGVLALEEALRLAERQNDVYRLFRSLNNLMLAAGISGAFGSAQAAASRATALWTSSAVDDGMDVVWFLTNQGIVHLLQEEYEAALTTWQRGLDVAARTGMLGQRTVLHALRAWAFLERGLRSEQPQDLLEAETAAREAESVAQMTGEPFALNLALVVSARLKVQRGEGVSAFQSMCEALIGCWRSENLTLLFWLLPYLAETLECQGKTVAASTLAAFLVQTPFAKRFIHHRAQAILDRLQARTLGGFSGGVTTLEDAVTHFLFSSLT